MTERSARLDVRNPLLGLPAAKQIMDLAEPARSALRALLRDIRADAARRAEQSWKKHKAPMAAYWKAVSVNPKGRNHGGHRAGCQFSQVAA